MEEQDQKIHQEIIGKIKNGEVTMHSRQYWVWRAVLWALALALLGLALVFMVSFVIFSLKSSGVWDLPSFGARGVRDFFAFFPWLFVPAVLLFLWLMERFVRQYAFAYRLPVLYSALGLIAVIVAASVAILLTPLHNRLYIFAHGGGLPFGGIYRYYPDMHPDDFYVGRLVYASSSGCTLMERDGKLIDVSINGSTRVYDQPKLNIGDFVEVVGDEQSGKLTAIAIRKIDPASQFPRRPPMEGHDYYLPPPLK
jgi:hypothetical protein